MVSFVKATNVEKANVVLDKVIDQADSDPDFLKTKGVFRVSASSDKVDSLIAKMNGDPSQLSFDDTAGAEDKSHIIIGILKRHVLAPNVWSEDAAAILSAEFEEDKINLNSVIQKLIAGNHLEEAKMLHNLLHLGNLTVLESESNSMGTSNMSIIFAPWFASLINMNPVTMMQFCANAGKVDDIFGITEKNANGEFIYGKTFDQTYPHHALTMAAQHAEIPARDVKAPAGTTSARSANVSASIESIGSRITSGFKAFGDWVTKTALPKVRDFFTKTIPSWFGRLTGKKEPLVEQRKSLSESELPLVQTPVDAPKTQPWQPVAPQVDQSEKVVMGSQVRGPLPDAPPQTPPPRPPRNSDSVRVRAKIVSAKIDPEEQTAIKESKDKAMKFFKDLEQKGKDILPKRDKPKNKG